MTASNLWGDTESSDLWTDYTLHYIDNFGIELLDVLPNDISNYCPQYLNMPISEKKYFWVALLSALAKFESGYDPAVTYQEAMTDAQGNPVISRGLLQLSIESANGYGCNITDAQQLHDPEVNIRCGVVILNHWVGKRDVVISDKVNGKWLGAARYWSPFRIKRKKAAIAEKIKLTTQCS